MTEHVPVLLERVVDIFRTCLSQNSGPNWKLVDATLGLGGYSGELLRSFGSAQIYALDRDKAALDQASTKLSEFGTQFRSFHANFGDIEDVVGKDAPFDGFVFDLGVSNLQLSEAERGFSFQNDGPLDMRMNPDGGGETAAALLERPDAQALAEIFWTYGEERFSRRIAAKIKEAVLKGAPPRRTEELVALIRETLPAPVQRKMGTHPARRVFQALRIYLNDELSELESALAATKKLAAPGAVLIVVSYHSLEDRIVKRTFREWDKEKKLGMVLTRHPEIPDDEEIEQNFKARSAKLRAFKFAGNDDLSEITGTKARPGRRQSGRYRSRG